MNIERYEVGPLNTFCYLIYCSETKEAMLVDPADTTGALKKKIEQLDVKIKYIVNTHGHPDHTSGNKLFIDAFHAPLVMHPIDDEFFRTKEARQMIYSWGFDISPPADIHIKDGDTINIGKLSFTCIHTPGHSPGSICLYGHGHVITGDTLFVGAAGRTDLPGGSFEQLISSICKKLSTLPDETIVLPGHNYGETPTSTIAKEKKNNIFMKDC